jgi:TonB family protein
MQIDHEEKRCPRSRDILIALGASFTLLFAATVGAQATTSGVIMGVVVDSTLDVGIAGAEVLLEGTSRHAMTDERGQFRIDGEAASGGTLRVRRLGFHPKVVAASGPTGLEPIRVQLAPATQHLTAVLVRGERTRYTGRLAGYYERLEQRSVGQFITRAEMERERQTQLSQVLRRAPGVTVGRGRAGIMNSVRMRGRDCWPLVWLDGAQMGAGDVDIDSFSPSSLEGIELYLGSTNAPSRYQGMRGKSECGTILLWSRGSDTEPRSASRGVTPTQLESLIASLSVFTSDEVDTAAALDTIVTPPLPYPQSMRAAGINGVVIAEFVVDTAGGIEPDNFGIVAATHPLFAEAVQAALRTATFRPAVRRGRAVRQLVRQPFEFHAPRTERARG